MRVYRGVFHRNGRWVAWITIGGITHQVAGFASVEEAAVGRDRLLLHANAAADRARLNFPRRRLSPASVEELRRELWSSVKAATTSKYRGVYWSTRNGGRWIATISVKDRIIGLGQYRDEEQAARAYDRAARELRSAQTRLNFPDDRLAPATPEELARERHEERRRMRSSRYQGVTWSRSEGKWLVFIAPAPGRKLRVAAYLDERTAARAYDRIARLILGPRAKLNFPGRTEAADLRKLRREARETFKETTTSRYRGVSWSLAHGAWVVQIDAENRHYSLGIFDDEILAARAYDRAAAYLHGSVALLNFPHETPQAASPTALLAEKGRARKRLTSSKYRGVTWASRERKWVARIWANGAATSLGYFDNEREAARAWDVAARALRGRKALLNFPE